MRRRPPGPQPGVLCFAAGIAIILAIVLPASFWWFALGAALAGGGIVIIIRH